jgi:uncharacterized membrane protein
MADDPHSTPAPPAAAPAPGRLLRIALFVSLALNLLIVGAILGAFIGERRDAGADHRVSERTLIPLGLGLYARALDPGDRQALLGAARQQRAALQAPNRDIRQGMAALATAVRAEPFDPVRVQAVLDRQGRAVMRQLEIGRALLVDRLAEMPPEARAAFADRLEAGLRRLPPPGTRP